MSKPTVASLEARIAKLEQTVDQLIVVVKALRGKRPSNQHVVPNSEARSRAIDRLRAKNPEARSFTLQQVLEEVKAGAAASAS